MTRERDGLRIEPLPEPESFLDFTLALGVEIVVKERPKRSSLPRWYASAPGLEIMEGGFLTSTHGNGDTIEEAVDDYARLLAGKRIVLGAYRSNRREVVCPNEWSA